MRGHYEESPEVVTFRALVRAAERRVAAGLLDSPAVLDMVKADQELRRAARAYAATQPPLSPLAKDGGSPP